MSKKENISTFNKALDDDEQKDILENNSEEQPETIDPEKWKVIKIVKELTGLGLKDAKSIVDNKEDSSNNKNIYTIGGGSSLRIPMKNPPPLKIQPLVFKAKSSIAHTKKSESSLIKSRRIQEIKSRYSSRFPNPNSLDIISKFLYALEDEGIIFRKIRGAKLQKPEENSIKFSNITVLKHTDKNILSKIKDNFIENSDILIDNALPLITSKKFIDLIIEEKIPFSSIENKEICALFSKTLLYVSNKNKLWRGGNRNAGKNTKEPADQFAKEIGPILDSVNEEHKTLRAKAKYLNDNQIKTIRNKEWTAKGISNLLDRWKKLQTEEKHTNSSNPDKNQPKP